jgi:hypothetical protein
MDDVPLYIPPVAIALGAVVIWALHAIANKTPYGKKYLTPTVLTYATSAIIIYVSCFWVIGFILTALTGAHFLHWLRVTL